jgi:hypothetical protein
MINGWRLPSLARTLDNNNCSLSGGIIAGDFNVHERSRGDMQIDISPQPVVAPIAGRAILVAPKQLNFIVAIYLSVFGVLGMVRM